MIAPLARDPRIDAAIAGGAHVVFSISGGKDSSAALVAVAAELDRIGYPRERRLAVHADLGRVEWAATPPTVERIAAFAGVPLLVVRRQAGDLLDRWRQRFALAKRRYEALETYCLIGPWSSASLRFCTSEMKANVIGPAIARRFAGQTIVNVIGVRRDESANRRSAPVAQPDSRFAKPGNARGTTMLTWHPLADWSEADVYAAHAEAGIPLHEAYTIYGSPRLSCRFCILASQAGLSASISAPSNHEHYRELVALEASSTFSFQPARWLADIAPQLLSDALRVDVARAKNHAIERRRLEAALPPALRFVKGWPPRAPTIEEAHVIAATRDRILDLHHLANLYPTSTMVRRRFRELVDQRIDREART